MKMKDGTLKKVIVYMFFPQISAEWRFHMKTDCTGYLVTEMLGVRPCSLSNVFTKSMRQFHSFSLCLQYKEGTVRQFFCSRT